MPQSADFRVDTIEPGTVSLYCRYSFMFPIIIPTKHIAHYKYSSLLRERPEFKHGEAPERLEAGCHAQASI